MTKSLNLLSLALITTVITQAQIMYPGDVTTGTKEVVFDYSTDACSATNSMDGSANAFRDAEGNINLIVPNHDQYRITGPDFHNLTPDCSNGQIFTSDSDPSQANHNYKEWMSAPYTTDGKTMYGLVHNEFHGYDFSGLCGHADVLKCWYNSVTSVSSIDSGKTYTHAAAPNHLVASIPYKYDKDFGYRQGAFAPSNIIKHKTNGYYYAFFSTEERDLQQGGMAAMRTTDLSDPSSWRMYDGSGFNTENLNPYLDSNYDTSQYVFHVINGTKGIGGVYYSTYFEKYIMVTHSKYEIAGIMTEGMCYLLSDDLVTWGTKKMIYPVNQSVNSSTNNSSWDYGAYPSLIDHTDTTRNFEEIGQDAYLYYVKWNNTSNNGDPDRDLIRVPITFSKNMVTGFTVTGAGNQEDTNPGDGVCETPAGTCGYYAAIQESNGRLAIHADTILDIDFNMSSRYINATGGAGTIPTSTYPLNIDGTTNQSATENTADITDSINTYIGVRISLGGNPGLSFTGGSTTVKGLCISNPQNGAINFSNNGNNTVVGCFLGTNIAGTANQSETYDGWGVYIDDVPNVTIGGENAADRNLIIGGIKVTGSNATNIGIKGNFIGTDVTGTIDLEESEHGISVNNGARGVIIGGDNLGARNIISGNIRGIDIAINCNKTEIINNYIGLSMDGELQLGNGSAGISLGADSCSISDNIIGNNGSGEGGLWLFGSENTISKNIFGTNQGATISHPEGAAILLHGGASNNTIGGYTAGSGNIITNSTTDGIGTYSTAGTGNSFLGNSIYDNAEFGIDLGSDNQTLEEEVPAITLASIEGDSLYVSGIYTGTANSAYRIEFFTSSNCDGNGFGEGKTYLGYTTTISNNDGYLTFGDKIHAPATAAGETITCLATNGVGTTIEFSKCFTAAAGIPDIRLSDTAVEINVIVGQSGDKTITIYNDGTTDLTWTSTDNETWHQAGTEGSTISSGGFEGVTLNVFTNGLTAGTYIDTLYITSNDPTDPASQIEITLNVTSPNAEGNVDTAFYEMQPNRTESMTVYLKNTGTGTLTFTAGMGVGVEILAGVSPNSGSVFGNDSIEITVTMRSNGKSPGVYNDLIWFSTNDPITATEEIQVETLVDMSVGTDEITKEINTFVSSGILNIISSASFENIQSIDVIDATGRLIHTWTNISENKLSIKLNVKGTYFIKYNTSNNSISKSVLNK
jgi:hypothetical protein